MVFANDEKNKNKHLGILVLKKKIYIYCKRNITIPRFSYLSSVLYDQFNTKIVLKQNNKYRFEMANVRFFPIQNLLV